MKESLTSRVGRIVSGSVNALLSAVENAAPEMVMEEAIREIDGAIDEVRVELGRTVAARHLANTRLAEENRRHEELSAQIETAVKQGRDDLAEAGIARQLDIEAQIPVLENALADAADKERELEGYVQALQAKKREMKSELASFREAQQAAEAVSPTAAGASGGVADRVARAEAAFDNLMERRSGVPGGAAAPGGEAAAKLAELEELARRNRVQERLAALKAGKSGD